MVARTTPSLLVRSGHDFAVAALGVKQQQVGGRSRRPARSNAGCSLPDAGFSLVALPATTSALLLPLAVAVKQQPGCPQSGRRCDPRFRETRSEVLPEPTLACRAMRKPASGARRPSDLVRWELGANATPW
jgi:hypothetical protein